LPWCTSGIPVEVFDDVGSEYHRANLRRKIKEVGERGPIGFRGLSRVWILFAHVFPSPFAGFLGGFLLAAYNDLLVSRKLFLPSRKDSEMHF
jgi:hypothetical protein